MITKLKCTAPLRLMNFRETSAENDSADTIYIFERCPES